PSMVQHAGVVAWDCDVSGHVADYRRKRDRVWEGMKDRFDVVKSEGAFYLFPRAPWGGGTEFVSECIRNNLLLIPGNVFSRADTPAASATTRPTAAALLTRTGLVDRQRTPAEGRVVEAIDRSLRFLVVVHDDEAEAARAARLSVRDHLRLAHRPVLPEQSQQVVGGGVPHEVAAVNVLRHREKPFRARSGQPDCGPRRRTCRVPPRVPSAQPKKKPVPESSGLTRSRQRPGACREPCLP